MQFTTKQIGVVVVLLVISWAVLRPVQSAEPEAKRDIWEYKMDTTSGMIQVPQFLCAGAERWELVTVTVDFSVEKTGNCTAIFKRPKQ